MLQNTDKIIVENRSNAICGYRVPETNIVRRFVGNETKEMLIVNLDLEKVRFRRFRGLVFCEYLNLSEKSDLLKRKLAVCSNATSEINDIIKYVSKLGDILDESAR